jgi:hypothetical protein
MAGWRFQGGPCAMKTVEETLAELIDREEIRDLPLRYCDCVWRNDVAGVVDLFAADGSFTVKTPDSESINKGREALLRKFTEDLRELTPRPYIHNHVIELGYYGRATGRCYLEVRSEKRNMQLIRTGHYLDEYVKVGDRWKFAARYFTAVGSAPAKAAAPGEAAGRARPARKATVKAKPAKAKSAKAKPAKAKAVARRKAVPLKRKRR